MTKHAKSGKAARKPKWLDRRIIEMRHHYTLCTTRKGFNAEMRRLGVARTARSAFGSTHASCHFFTFNGKRCVLVELDVKAARSRGIKLAQMYSLLAHEAVHIWQEEARLMKEASPSDEFMAYSVQTIFQALLFEFMRQTRK